MKVCDSSGSLKSFTRTQWGKEGKYELHHATTWEELLQLQYIHFSMLLEIKC